MSNETKQPDVLVNVEGVVYDVKALKGPLPERAFREAWVFNKGVIKVDMEAAKELHRDKIRQARAEKFKETDAEVVRGLTDNQMPSANAELKKKIQALRDAPADPAIDKAKTPEELAAVWPEVLNA